MTDHVFDPQRDADAIPYGDIDLDKVPGAWMLTYWVPGEPEVTLRLKIKHYSMNDPDECVAELQCGSRTPFVPLGEFTLCPYAIQHPDDVDDDTTLWDDLPEPWRRELAAMVVIWARISDHVEPRSTYERPDREPVRPC